MTATPAAELAPAKVNLALHVTGRRADGLHLLDSLVVFPRLGDLVEAEPAAGLSLAIGGPFARDLSAGPDNLVLRAAGLFGAGPRRGAPARRSRCRSPAASAAAPPTPPRRSASSRGSGGCRSRRPRRSSRSAPTCRSASPARLAACPASGSGSRPVALPRFWLVLANPGVPLATAAVFAGLASRSNPALPEPPAFPTFEALAGWLAGRRNDLEPPAIAAAPVIAETVAALAAQPGCRLARMSGSGATCFGLFAAEAEALAAADGLRRSRPAWWVAAAPVG